MLANSYSFVLNCLFIPRNSSGPHKVVVVVSILQVKRKKRRYYPGLTVEIILCKYSANLSKEQQIFGDLGQIN